LGSYLGKKCSEDTLKMKNILYTIILSFLFSLNQSALAARCMEGLYKHAFRHVCSKYVGGEVVDPGTGGLVCSKGQCMQGLRWECSKIEGGAAVISYTGRVKCQGGCEKPSENNCVVPE